MDQQEMERVLAESEAAMERQRTGARRSQKRASTKVNEAGGSSSINSESSLRGSIVGESSKSPKRSASSKSPKKLTQDEVGQSSPNIRNSLGL